MEGPGGSHGLRTDPWLSQTEGAVQRGAAHSLVTGPMALVLNLDWLEFKGFASSAVCLGILLSLAHS